MASSIASSARPGVGKADGSLELLLTKQGPLSAPAPRGVEGFEAKLGANDPGETVMTFPQILLE